MDRDNVLPRDQKKNYGDSSYLDPQMFGLVQLSVRIDGTYSAADYGALHRVVKQPPFLTSNKLRETNRGGFTRMNLE
jgi:hypothetical protein